MVQNVGEINYLLSYMNTNRLINKQSASKTLSGIKFIGKEAFKSN